MPDWIAEIDAKRAQESLLVAEAELFHSQNGPTIERYFEDVLTFLKRYETNLYYQFDRLRRIDGRWMIYGSWRIHRTGTNHAMVYAALVSDISSESSLLLHLSASRDQAYFWSKANEFNVENLREATKLLLREEGYIRTGGNSEPETSALVLFRD